MTPASTPAAIVAPSAAASSTTTSAAAAIASPSPATIKAGRAFSGRSTAGFVTVEVGLVRFFLGEFSPSLQGQCGSPGALRRSLAAPHLRPLFLQNCLAGEPDAVALDREYLHQNLVAFLEFIANIFYAVLGNLADMQQAVGTRQDFYERAEIGEPGNLSQVCLAHLRRRG